MSHDRINQERSPAAKDKVLALPSGKALIHEILDPGGCYLAKVLPVYAPICPQHQGDTFQVKLGAAEIFGFVFSMAVLFDLLEVDRGVRYVFPATVRDG